MIDLLAVALQLLLGLPQSVGHLLTLLVSFFPLVFCRLQHDHSCFHFGQLSFIYRVFVLSLLKQYRVRGECKFNGSTSILYLTVHALHIK